MYNFHTDAGHGWLQVQPEELKRLNIQNKISKYSYVGLEGVYLEEDQDASTFINAKLKELSIDQQSPEAGQWFKNNIEYMDPVNNSFIRNLKRYK